MINTVKIEHQSPRKMIYTVRKGNYRMMRKYDEKQITENAMDVLKRGNMMRKWGEIERKLS